MHRLETETGYANLALGYLYSREGRIEEAYAKLTLARATFRNLQGDRDVKDLTRALNELARVARLRGDEEEARGLLLRSIELIHEADAPILAFVRFPVCRSRLETGGGNRSPAHRARLAGAP